MKHLDFINELNKFGCHLNTTNLLGKQKIIEIHNPLEKPIILKIKDYHIEVGKRGLFDNESAINYLIKEAIDIGEWKHSWHNEIIPENYPKFSEIIQKIILLKAEQIDLLMTAYMQLQYEMIKSTKETNGN